MSISAPPGQPSITQTLGSSFRDAAAVAKSNLIPAALLIVSGTICAYWLASSGTFSGPHAGDTMPAGLSGIIAVIDLLAVIVMYYAMAAAIRTIHADYRMTAAQFFGILGYSLVVTILSMIAGIFFIIPAYWVGGKLLLTPFTYAVTNGAPGALKTTWNMTTGYYWQTIGMVLLEGLCLMVIAYAVFFGCAFAAVQMPLSTIVLAPIGLAVLVWLMHVRALVFARWTNDLLPRANVPHVAAVMPA